MTPTPTEPSASLIAAATNEPAALAAPVAEPYVPLAFDALVAPEGFTLEQSVGDSLLSILNDQALSPVDRANALINLQAELTTKSSEAGSQAWNEQQQNWQAEISADPVLGGANLTNTIAGIGNLMDRFGTPEIRAAFDTTGAGNNPQIVRFLTTLVSQLKEPGVPGGGLPPGQGPRSLEERMYPTS